TTQALGRLVAHVRLVDSRPPRAAPAKVDQSLDGVGLPLEGGLDRSVRVVANPAGHLRHLRAPADGVAEEHSLDEAPDEHPPPDHGSSTTPAGSTVTDTRSPRCGWSSAVTSASMASPESSWTRRRTVGPWRTAAVTTPLPSRPSAGCTRTASGRTIDPSRKFRSPRKRARSASAGLAQTASGVPTWTTWPARMTATRSPRAKASDWSCVT